MRSLRRSLRRPAIRSVVRRPFRPTLRGCLRGPGGPDGFSQMIAAYGRAVRVHRQLARLAPSFFDAAVVDRERENRAEIQKWMAMWEPVLAKAYGVDPTPPDVSDEWPRLPPPRTRRAVERHLAEFRLWLAAGTAARQRLQQRRPHAIPSLSQLARLLQLAFDLKCLALGLNSPNPLPARITYDYEFADLKRAYGHVTAPVSTVVPEPSIAPAVTLATDPLLPPSPPLAATSLPGPAPAVVPPPAARCDAWSRWARQVRRAVSR